MSSDGEILRRARLAMLANDGHSFNVDAIATRGRTDAWWQSWAQEASQAHSKIVIFAEVGEEVVGMIAAHTEDGVAHAGALWVGPKFRRRGIASVLLDGVESWAHDVRATAVELSVAQWNKGALRLYELHHYRDTARRQTTRFGHLEIVLDKLVGF
jgi:ribosomal protein S18 acetylase RimI-like enzyme